MDCFRLHRNRVGVDCVFLKTAFYHLYKRGLRERVLFFFPLPEIVFHFISQHSVIKRSSLQALIPQPRLSTEIE